MRIRFQRQPFEQEQTKRRPMQAGMGGRCQCSDHQVHQGQLWLRRLQSKGRQSATSDHGERLQLITLGVAPAGSIAAHGVGRLRVVFDIDERYQATSVATPMNEAAWLKRHVMSGRNGVSAARPSSCKAYTDVASALKATFQGGDNA